MSLSQEPHIDLAIEQSSRDLKRLSALYKARGKDAEAAKIDDTIERLNRRAVESSEKIQRLQDVSSQLDERGPTATQA